MPFPKGVSGNISGRPKDIKPVLDRLRMLCVQEDWVRVREGLNAVLDKAREGEPWAIEFCADRFDGRPAQAITGADGGALQVVIQATSNDEKI